MSKTGSERKAPSFELRARRCTAPQRLATRACKSLHARRFDREITVFCVGLRAGTPVALTLRHNALQST
jgi:hypothetical protein